MPFCPKCASEFRSGFERCEECDCALVPEKPRLPSLAFEKRVAVYQTTQFDQAAFVSSLLEGNGYPATVENEHVSRWMFGMSTPAFPLRVSVTESDAVAAAGIVEEIRATAVATPSKPTWSNRNGLIALALLVPGLSTGAMYLGGTQAFASAGAWAALALGLILNLRDRHPGRSLSEAKIGLFFLLGGAAAVGVGFLPIPVEDLGIQPYTAQHAFAIIGPVEEIAKVLPVLFAITLADRRRPFSWVLAAAASGAGFGMVENLLKFTVYRGPESAFITSTTGLLHPLLTGLIGVLIARHGWFGGFLGLIIASLMHGAWDALAFNDLWFVNLAVLAIAAWAYFANVDGWVSRIPAGDAGQPINSSSAPAT